MSQSARDRLVYNYIWSAEDELEPAPAFVSAIARSEADDSGGRTLLDLGCGSGRHSLWAARRGWSVRAIDHSAAAIGRLSAQVASEGLRCEVVLGDAFATATAVPADVVVCFDAIHHDITTLTQFRSRLAQVFTAVRPGGQAVLSLLTDIRYSSGETPEGRYRVTSVRGREILTDVPDGWDIEDQGSDEVYIPHTMSYDSGKKDLIPTDYSAVRLWWAAKSPTRAA